MPAGLWLLGPIRRSVLSEKTSYIKYMSMYVCISICIAAGVQFPTFTGQSPELTISCG